MSLRDNFIKATKEELAHRAGYKCSKPDCRAETRGATEDGRGRINIGVAAHITSAARSGRGPRYDDTLTPEQRKSYDNGIWLCASHAKLVDSDTCHYTVEQLREWKRDAERCSFLEVVSQKSRAGASTAEQDAHAGLDSLLDAGRADIAAFQRVEGFPVDSIALNLRMRDGDDARDFTAGGLAAGVRSFDQVAVVAPPGTGKSVTLLQLTEAIVAEGSCMAVFFPLAEWAEGSDDFIPSLLKRRAFKRADNEGFEAFATQGRLVLVLDGWNELDEASKKRGRSQIKSLRRDFSELRLVISSRHRDFDLPIDGPVVEVRPLTYAQQLEMARLRRGAQGESLIDQAWRTGGLRDLVAIPLYLKALLARTPGARLPQTKEEILRSFVEELEVDRDKLAVLRETLQGLHWRFMEAIAVKAMRLETVALSEPRARATVNAAQRRLKEENQITNLLQPMEVLDRLVSAHLLVRYGGRHGSVSFQHQQFQEWFASFHVERLMLSCAQGDERATGRLRESILDVRVWEEAILFACDRLSRSGEDAAKAVAGAVVHTLGIDPQLAAHMIRRSSDDVWALAGRHVVAFASGWYASGPRDRAVGFMIDTGCPEFAGFVWPLISDPDNQVHLRALRAGRRFRPGVLGANAEDRIAELEERLRRNITREIAISGDMEGIELATRQAMNDESPEVKLSVVESLLLRRADRYARRVLESATDEVWSALAEKWHHRDIDDKAIAARIRREWERRLAEESDPVRMLSALLNERAHDPATEQQVGELVRKIDFAGEEQNVRWLVDRAYENYPDAVASALLCVLTQGRDIPFGCDEMLRGSELVVEDGPLTDALLADTVSAGASEAATGVLGPASIGRIVDRMMEVRTRGFRNERRVDETAADEYDRLQKLVSRTKTKPFAQAVLSRSDRHSPREMAMLAGLVSAHGVGVKRSRLALDSALRDRLTAAVREWAEHLLGSPEATRRQYARIADAAQRLGSPRLVDVLLRLLSEDRAKRKQAVEALMAARRRGRQIENDAQWSFSLAYRRAFAAIGDDRTVKAMRAYLADRDFGMDAATVLKSAWLKERPQENGAGRVRSWPDYSVVPENRRKRQAGDTNVTHPLAEYVFAAIDDVIGSGADDVDLGHALRLATVAFSMPYADKEQTIAELIGLAVREAEKRDLLITLVLAGESISHEVVLRGIEELLEDAKTKPWLLNEREGWRLREWLKVLAFTERPGAILKVLQRTVGFRSSPWEMRDVLSALGYAPAVEAEAVLVELAKRDERYLGEHEWLEALIGRNSLSAARSLLDVICNASFSDKRLRTDQWVLARSLARCLRSHGEFRKDVYERFAEMAEGHARSTLKRAIAEAADSEGVLLLVRAGPSDGKRFRSTHIHTALRNVLVGRMAIGSSGAEELYGVPVPELRRALFHLFVQGNASESELAKESLCAFDEIRDDYGHVDSERRHPDVSAGVAWPSIGNGCTVD